MASATKRDRQIAPSRLEPRHGIEQSATPIRTLSLCSLRCEEAILPTSLLDIRP